MCLKYLNIVNLVLLIPFILVLSTVFIVNNDMPNATVSGKYIWFYLSMALISASTFLSFIINRKSTRFSFIDLLISIFCILTIIIGHSYNSLHSNRIILLLLILILYFYFRFFIIQSKWSRFFIIIFFIFTGLIEAIWGLRQLYGLLPSHHNLFTATGSFFNPGPYAGYLATIAPLASYYVISDYRILKNKLHYNHIPFYIRWTISLSSLICILLILPATMSRASWIAATVGCSISFLLYLSKRKNIFKLLTLYMRQYRTKSLVIGVSTILILSTALTSIYYIKKDSADGRSFIWKISLSIIKDMPQGVGIGNFSGAYGKKQLAYFMDNLGSTQEERVAGNPEYAFNEYLQICVEFGIIPFFIFIFIIMYALYLGIKRGRSPFIGGFVAILVFAFMSYPFSVLPHLISIILIIVLCVSDKHPNIVYSRNSLSRNVAFIISLVMITGTLLYNRIPMYKAYHIWQNAKKSYNMYAYKDIIRDYTKIYFYLDHELEFLFEYAQCLSKTSHFEESNKVLQKATLISCDPMLYNIMGKNYQSLKQYEQAEKSFRQASYIVPNRMYPHYLLFKLYYETGSMEKAKQTAEHALNKRIKVDSPAVQEMRKEIKELLETIKE